MKSILHLSDLHFGTEIPEVLAGLRADLVRERPTLVTISGDLTQRATPDQFRAARAFLDELPSPYIVVPGNHDVPLYNLYERFFRPLRRYRKYVTDDLTPEFQADDLVVMGIATAHGKTFKNGHIEPSHLAHICTTMTPSPARWKVLVAHHPFSIPHGVDDEPLHGAKQAMPRLEASGVDIILTGHLHVAHSTDAAGFRTDDRRVVEVHAGSAISHRLRGESNGYNRLEVDGPVLRLVNRLWDGARFVDGPSKLYRREEARDGEPTFIKLETKEGTQVPVEK